MTSLVDCVSSSTTTSRPMMKPPRNFSARSRSRAGIGNLERKIDGPRRMSDRANGNEINPGRGDLPDVLQSNPAAGFEFHFAFSDRDRLANLRRFHVVEKNHVDALDPYQAMDLLEGVGFHFYPHIRPRFAA